MVLVYSDKISSRLEYILHFILEEQLHSPYTITTDWEKFCQSTGTAINYSSRVSEKFSIKPHPLLFEETITEQQVECFETNGYKAFFKTKAPDFSFDIFSAAFYLLSRYEEYLPHTKDIYGRYAHENSLAYREHFLKQPLLNTWIKDFAFTLKKRFSAFSFQFPVFRFLPTYDIDMAYSFKHKGIIRNIAGFIKSPSLQRIRVMMGAEKDPFDAFDEMNELNNGFEPVYFFLAAQKIKGYDKNILPGKKRMKELVRETAGKYEVALHPSWQSGDNHVLLKNEKHLLEKISGREITKSRQHYIRFNLPHTYRQLMDAGITDDYSMGYGSINGFRASVASAFFWFDLNKNEQTALRIHPFCFMEANSYYEQKQNAEETFDELIHYYSICKTCNGTLITIWHNNFLGTSAAFSEWGEMYSRFLELVKH